MTRAGQVYEVRLHGRLLCESRTPFFSAARVLALEGADPDTVLEMVRSDTNAVCLRGRLGFLSRLTVKENETEGPCFARYRPPPDSFARTSRPPEVAQAA